MRAAIVPSVKAACVAKDVHTPELGPTQVLVKIRVRGICYTDVHQTRGELPGAFPRTLGHEPVGDVVAVGSGVTSRKVVYDALAVAASGKVRVVTETYPLEAIRSAYERVERGEVRFRAVVTM
jgi:D-arabinose 1-dehydrogenase-like Zn-dependent alcohol dehydrogenase